MFSNQGIYLSLARHAKVVPMMEVSIVLNRDGHEHFSQGHDIRPLASHNR